MTPPLSGPSRRQLIGALAALGIGSATFRRAAAAQAQQPMPAGPPTEVTPEMIQQAEWIAGIELSEDDRKAAARAMTQTLRSFRDMRAAPLDNGVPLALAFNPAPWLPASTDRGPSIKLGAAPPPKKPATDDELAFSSVADLGRLLRAKQISSVELTKLYLARLRKYDPTLICVVNLTEELALKQAEQADRDLAAGTDRGPLHGIPWGAKDLIAYPGYKTTWGATPFKDQVLDVKATVAKRLEEAGAVLVAKLSLGALAQGDRWMKKMTRNPWNPQAGSSGSSAGSASATAAGLVGFALGSETLGSIVSPSRVCGNSSLRPTFGRVSRHGCMTLCWSLDKIGPLCRSVEDCALVLAAIHGTDGLDPTVVDRPFAWPCPRELKALKVGHLETDKDRPELKVLADLGVTLVPIKLPTRQGNYIQVILNAESAAAFDDLTRKKITEDLGTWPRTFQLGEFIPAVEYIRANRLRSQLMREMNEVMQKVDLYFGGNDLVLTNLTGHPTVALPSGFVKRGEREQPTVITFTGRLYGESELLAVAHAYQQKTGHHLKHPTLDEPAPPKEKEKEKEKDKPDGPGAEY